MKTKAEICAADNTVKQCLEVAPSPAGTYYLIETTFETFPKFVIGEVDERTGMITHRAKCGAEWSARKLWDEIAGKKVGRW